MRRRARHRLIGAAVLVLAGVVGFPLLFDSQPRPVPVNVAIDIPDRNKVAPLVVPQPDGAAAARPAAAPPPPAPAPERAPSGLAAGEQWVAPAAPRTAAVAAAEAPARAPAVAEARPAAAPRSEPRPEPKAEPKAEPRPEPRPEPRAEPKADPKPEPRPEHKPEPRPEPKPARSDDAGRARALLEGREPAAPPARAEGAEAGRFIVQVGAFADADKAREVREKLERAGLKTYTQAVDTKDGRRTRVRVGPFASRAEADKAAERIKGAGLAGSVLAL